MLKIKIKCDICGKEQKHINTLILHKKKIDYCDSKKCEKKALKIMEKFKREIEYQNVMYNSILKSKENELIKEIKK